MLGPGRADARHWGAGVIAALNTFLDEALDQPRAPRRRRALVGCGLAVAIAEWTVVAALVLLDVVRMAVGVGDGASSLVAAVGATR